MTHTNGAGLSGSTGRWRPTPTQVVTQRVRELRALHGWSAATLATKCADVGAPTLNRSVIANLESGRRDYVTIDEVLALAVALDVAPLHLMVPTDDLVTHRQHGPVLVDGYRLTDRLSVDSLRRVRAWIRGELAIPGVDRRIYDAERPTDDDRVQPDPDEMLAYLRSLSHGQSEE